MGFPYSRSYDIPAAFPGTILNTSQPWAAFPQVQSSTPVTIYGNPCVLTTTGVRPVAGTDTSATPIYGAVAFQDFTTDTSYPPTGFIWPGGPSAFASQLSILTSGTIAVYVAGTSTAVPVAGQPVYIQTTAVTGIPVGYLSATSSVDNFAWPGAKWAVSGVDENGFGAISLN
jgi:hypothetical protein